MVEPRCIAGCMHFTGGDVKHHRHCPNYPESLTKLWHDTEAEYSARITALEAERDRLRDGLDAIRQYGSDTLGGPSVGVIDDRDWQRESVLEMTNRADRVLRGDHWKDDAGDTHD